MPPSLLLAIVLSILILTVGALLPTILILGIQGASDCRSAYLRGCLAVLFIVFVSCRYFEQVLTEMLGEADASVVAAREHQPMQQIPYSKYIACF